MKKAGVWRTVKKQNTGQWKKQQWCHCSEKQTEAKRSKLNEKTKSQGEDTAAMEKIKTANAYGLQ